MARGRVVERSVEQLAPRREFQASLPAGEYVIYRPGAWRWLSRARAWTPMAEEAERFPSIEAARLVREGLDPAARKHCYVVEARRG